MTREVSVAPKNTALANATSNTFLGDIKDAAVGGIKYWGSEASFRRCIWFSFMTVLRLQLQTIKRTASVSTNYMLQA